MMNLQTFESFDNIIGLRLLVLIQYMNVTDRHPDRQTPHNGIGRAYA